MTQPRKENETAAIRYLIHQRLNARRPVESVPADAHLDEDTLCAFVEARFEEVESLPIISHLIACAACRQTTAQLVRLESRFDAAIDTTSPDEGPGRLRQIIDLASGLVPSTGEDAVFAYQSPPEDPDLIAPEATEKLAEPKSHSDSSKTEADSD